MSKQLALDCDNKAMKFILPNYRDKTYWFLSYRDMLSFFSNPISDKYSGPFAPQTWLALPICDKLDIEKRIKTLKNYYPYLAVYIEDIKHENSEFLDESLEGCKKFLLANTESFSLY
jgi:hypothetical protein